MFEVIKLNAKQAITDINSIVDRFLHAHNDISDELDKQVIIALIFGAMNRYAQTKDDIEPSDLQALLIYVLIQRFAYNEESAGRYSAYLVQCTDKSFHPVIYNLIINGMSLYDIMETPALLTEQIEKTLSAVKN